MVAFCALKDSRTVVGVYIYILRLRRHQWLHSALSRAREQSYAYLVCTAEHCNWYIGRLGVGALSANPTWDS